MPDPNGMGTILSIEANPFGLPHDPTPVENVMGSLARGITDYVATPGSLMQPNPYPAGSEEADYYDTLRDRAATNWAGQTALNTIGTGAFAGPEAGAAVLTAGAAKPPIRLYRGERDWGPYPNERYKPRAQFWSTDLNVAKQYGEPRYIDVSPEELAQNFFTDEKGHYQTPDVEFKYHGLAQPIPVAKPKMGALADTSLFDTSNLSAVPDVKQFDLPRYAPPRGVPQRIQDLVANPDVRQKMLDTIARGQAQGGAGWYNAEPLRAAFIDELGKKKGGPAFQQYMDFVAATSPRSDVPTNVRNASYYYTLARQGEPMPSIGTANPQPYGHIAQRLHQQNALNVAGEGWDPLQNPKPASFAQNLAGNQMPVTVDTHAFRLPAILAQDPRFLETAYNTGKGVPNRNIMGELAKGKVSMEDALATPAFWQAQPKANEYAAMEQYYKSLGAELGLTPAQTQASAWVGGGPLTGLASASDKAFVDFVNDRAVKTAQVKEISPAEALSRMIRGKEPLLAIPPVAVMGASAALQPDQERP